MTVEPVTPRGRRTRDRLLAGAREVFEARGFSDTRMSDISIAAGVSHGTVYTYFESKEAVLRALCTSVSAEVFEAVRVPDDLRIDPVRRIEEGNRRYLRVYASHARMLEVVEQAATADPGFRAVLDGLRAGFVEKAKGTLSRFQSDGLADPGVDIEIAGPALVGMVESFARRWYAHGAAYDVEHVVVTLSQLWARAIGLAVPDPQGAQR
jgi:AcrR family transcriptional regulator